MFRCRSSIFLALLFALVSGGCGGGSPSTPDVKSLHTINLLTLLPKAKLEEGKPYGNVRIVELSVGGDARESMFMHPTSRATFPPVRLTLDSRLEVSMGINEEAWGQAGDGVEFSVFVQPAGGKEVRVFSTYLDPKHEQRDRRWVDGVVTLSTYAGQDVALTLETGPGPAKNLSWDWAGWSRAMLFVGRE